MANQPGLYSSFTSFRKGTVLTAEDMNRIVRAVVRRIEGGKGIRVRAFGGRIIIEEGPQ